MMCTSGLRGAEKGLSLLCTVGLWRIGKRTIHVGVLPPFMPSPSTL